MKVYKAQLNLTFAFVPLKRDSRYFVLQFVPIDAATWSRDEPGSGTLRYDRITRKHEIIDCVDAQPQFTEHDVISMQMYEDPINWE